MISRVAIFLLLLGGEQSDEEVKEEDEETVKVGDALIPFAGLTGVNAFSCTSSVVEAAARDTVARGDDIRRSKGKKSFQKGNAFWDYKRFEKESGLASLSRYYTFSMCLGGVKCKR